MNSDAGFFAISDETGNSQFHSTGNSSADFGLGESENFPSEDQCTGNSQSLQSGAIILHQRDTIQSAQGGHSLIKVTGGGSDTDFFTWSGHSS